MIKDTNRYDGRMEDKNDAITSDAQMLNGNKDMYHHHRGAINHDVDISGENVAEEYHNEENRVILLF